jgi:superfamily II DNA/RNA helicase
MPAANKVFLEKESLSLDVIKQFRVEVAGPDQKFHVLERFIFANADRLGQTIIFVHSRRTARELHEVGPGRSIALLGNTACSPFAGHWSDLLLSYTVYSTCHEEIC